MSKRKLKKAILAEALAVYRTTDFGCRSFTVDVTNGQLVYVHLPREYRPIETLMHLCAQLNGDRP